ncbi:unnamed protein product [Timema podura]|uniref:Uncharacterized protein n=1 Tax=Timema podura TaxID=61482 RepID=A0ABN7PSV1_TIMPD|nr:unnamed protein product [Timema podura]
MTHETAGLLKEMVENHYLVVEMVDAGGDVVMLFLCYRAVTSNLSASPNRMPFTLTRKPGMSDEQFSTLCTLITQMYESYSVPLGVSVTTHSDVGVSLNTAAMENLTLDNRPNKSTTAQNLGNVLLNSILSSKSVQDPFLRKETINTAVKTQGINLNVLTRSISGCVC